MKYIGNIPELNIVHTTADRYDYVYASNPTIDVNPSVSYATWLNITTGELFVCKDTTEDLNIWQGQLGSTITSYEYNLPTAVILNSFPTIGATPSGVTYTGEYLAVCDQGTDLIYLLDPVTLLEVSRFSTPSGDCKGLAFDGDNLISVDATTHRGYIHAGVTATTTTNFAMPGSAQRGITIADGNLISTAEDTSLIYIHSGITDSVSSSFACPAGTQSVTFDGVNLISSSSTSTTITVHDGVSAGVVTSFSSPNGNPTGVTIMDGRLVSIDYITDTIYVHKHAGEI